MATRPVHEKIAALAACAVSSTGTDAARMTGLPSRTVRGWKQEQAVDGNGDLSEAVEETVKAIRPGMIGLASQIVLTAAGIVAEQLEELKHTKVEWKPSELRDVTIVAGVWVDKWRLLAADQNATTAPQSLSADSNPTIIVPNRQGRIG
jgi:hypothetical protein